MLRDLLREELAKVIKEDIQITVSEPERPENGDYTTNAAFLIAKKEDRKPHEVAEELKSKLEKSSSNIVEKIDIGGSGFLNFWVKKENLLDGVNEVLENPDAFGKSNIGKNKKVIVEYFQLNIAKRPHIGHLRSAVIGDAIKRMLLAFGYEVISDTHVGDWGTQFGILICALKQKHTELNLNEWRPENPFEWLEGLYIEGNAMIESNPRLRELAKEEFAKLERDDVENRKYWEWIEAISMQQLEYTALRLGLLKFDEHKGESSYTGDMPGIIEEALKKGVAQRKEDGAVVADLKNEGLDEAVLLKSDGASTYLLRDLATIKYREQQYNFWRNLYVVDARQEHHFKQVFSVAEKLGYGGVNESAHIAFGFMKLTEGAISTRAGTAISLEGVIDEARRRAKKIIEEKNPDLEKKEVVALQVGLGALKYFDLSHNRHSDIIFKWDEALSFEGDTGPYLQYTYARLKSIVKKSGREAAGEINKDIEIDSIERSLLSTILRFPEIIEDALSDFLPNILANYLFKLAQKANEFYHSRPVLRAETEAKKNLRLALAKAMALTLQKGLDLLGIWAPEEM